MTQDLRPTALSPIGGGLCPHKKRKKTYDLRKIGNIGKITKMVGGRS